MRVTSTITGAVALPAFGFGAYVMVEGGWYGSPVMAAAVALAAAPYLAARRARSRA